MKLTHILPVTILVISPLLGQKNQKKNNPNKEWKLVWSDEFSDRKLNTKNWTRVPNGKSDWNNMMSLKSSLVEIKNGVLKLKGTVNEDQKTKKILPFLTAGITSQKKYNFKYGKVEIRARFQSAQGAWPALWMLKSNVKTTSKEAGEMDLMEHLNFDDYVYQTIHTQYTWNNIEPDLKRYAKTPIIRDKWNTYGVIWVKDKLVFTVNGKPTFSYEKHRNKDKTQYTFNGPFYFILSMQIEGEWVGKANPKDYPAFMEIDYVRVYKKK